MKNEIFSKIAESLVEEYINETTKSQLADLIIKLAKENDDDEVLPSSAKPPVNVNIPGYPYPFPYPYPIPGKPGPQEIAFRYQAPGFWNSFKTNAGATAGKAFGKALPLLILTGLLAGGLGLIAAANS